MVRHADMETALRNEDAYPHRSLETGGMACHAGPHGEAPGRSGGSEQKENVGKRVYCSIHMKAQARQGKQA